jgi:hypothetical protein
MSTYIGVKDLVIAPLRKRDFFIVDQVAAMRLEPVLAQSQAPDRADLEWLMDSGALIGVDEVAVVQYARQNGVGNFGMSFCIAFAASILELLQKDAGSQWSNVGGTGRRGLHNDLLRAAASYVEKHKETTSIPLLDTDLLSSFEDWRRQIDELNRIFSAVPDSFGYQVTFPGGVTWQDSELFGALKETFQSMATQTVSTAESENGTSAVEILLHEFPAPDDSVPWEKVLDFVRDKEVLTSRLELRRWIRKIATQELSAGEIREEIEYLQARYHDHVRWHKLKTQPGHLQTLISAPAEMLQHILRLRIGDAAKSLFSFRQRKLAMMEAEREAPGRELAYIVTARSKFGN